MTAALFGTVFLVFFMLSPLHWVALGMPWITLVITFLLIPLLDAAVGAPGPGPRSAPAFARWIPRLQLPLQIVLLVQAVRIAPQLEWSQLVVFALAVGTVTGSLGITIAHELGHRASRLDRFIAKALLVTVCYGHFFVEHVRGHHVRVATPDDPATAPRGMSVYRFIVRSVIGSFTHAWKLEAMRLERKGRGAWQLDNWVLAGTLLVPGARRGGGLGGRRPGRGAFPCAGGLGVRAARDRQLHRALRPAAAPCRRKVRTGA